MKDRISNICEDSNFILIYAWYKWRTKVGVKSFVIYVGPDLIIDI